MLKNRRLFIQSVAALVVSPSLSAMAGATTDSGPGGSRVPSQNACEEFVDRIISWKPGESKNGIGVVASEPSSLIGIVQQIPELNVPESLWLGAINTEQFFSVIVDSANWDGGTYCDFTKHQVPSGAAFCEAVCPLERSNEVRISGANQDGYSIGISRFSAAFGLYARGDGDFALVMEQDDRSAKSGSGPLHDPYQSEKFQRALVQFLGSVVKVLGEKTLLTADGYRGPENERPIYKAGTLLTAAMTYNQRRSDALQPMMT
jgi:hypothetical protein